MSLAQKAADDIKNFVSRIRPLLDASDALEKIGNIEQLASEAVTRKQKADAEYEELKKQIELLKSEKLVHAKEISDAKAFAGELISNAEKKCEQLEGASSRKVSGICGDAIKSRSLIEEEISKMKSLKASIANEIEQKNILLKQIKDEISQAKSKIQQLIRL